MTLGASRPVLDAAAGLQELGFRQQPAGTWVYAIERNERRAADQIDG